MIPLCVPSRAAVERLLDRFAQMRVGVLGDVMLDQFVYGKVERISPEAPVPVVEVEREVFHLGGAANVVHNLRSLGASVDLVGVLGEDDMAAVVKAHLAALGVMTDGLVAVPGRPTALKTRVIAQHQQVVRFDREHKNPLPADVVAALGQCVEACVPKLRAVIVSDYGKGVVGPEVMETLLAAAGRHGVWVFVDPKPPNVALYRGVDVVTPNLKETEEMTGRRARTDDEAVAAGRALRDRLGARAILVTRGERGMTLVTEDEAPTHIPTHARDVFDVTGAGDTAISTLALAWAAGAPLTEAAQLANVAAGIVVGKLGTAAVSAAECLDALEPPAGP
ncbi:MAG: D-glycero-beta-D-manno-heptose-7-phosphate kinase [Deltaproteobacteria bacterium]|nr:D-glycero-beta-D-manno-heptose-7-phosphate kinase [Deltaproteobacteria bacterium]